MLDALISFLTVINFQKNANSSLSLCYSTVHSTAASSVNNSNSNIVSSVDTLDRGDRQVNKKNYRFDHTRSINMFWYLSSHKWVIFSHHFQVGTVAAIDGNGREKISLSSFSNASGAGPKRLSVGDGSRSRSTWQTRGNALSSEKASMQTKVLILRTIVEYLAIIIYKMNNIPNHVIDIPKFSCLTGW